MTVHEAFPATNQAQTFGHDNEVSLCANFTMIHPACKIARMLQENKVNT